MSKTGIFAHFGSKQQLQLATVGAARQIFVEQVVKPGLTNPRGLPRVNVMLESWLGYVERIVFRGDEIASLTKAWLMALQGEIAFALKKTQIKTSIVPSQLAFEMHAYLQEAN